MVTEGAFNLLFRPGLRKDFRDEYNKYDTQYTEFLNTGNIDVPEISATIMSGPNRLLERNDGEPITYEDAKIGPKVMAVDKEFALGFIISRKTVEDDQYGKANGASKWLANSARLTMEYRSAAFLDDAFTGATYLGIDGLKLCHTAHTCLNSSSTYGNTPASQVQLSLAGITSMLDLTQLLKDHNGDPIPCMPSKLIIGNNAGDQNRALQIFNSTLEPFTTENQDNAIKRRLGKMPLTTSVYKSSTKSYFMIDQKLNDAYFLTRRAVNFDDTFDFDTDAAKYKATTRFLIWFVDPRGWFGTNPT